MPHLVRHRGSLCNHLWKIKPEEAARLIPLENTLVRITQQDVVYRQYRRDHRLYVPDFGVYIVRSRVPR